MAFEILNEAASVLYVLAGENRYPQAEPDKVDFDILAQGIVGEGVVSGCAVTPQGAPDTTVAVAAGVIRIQGTDFAYAGGNVNCGAAHAAFPRFDLIAIGVLGASAVAGVAAEPPVFPAVPANSVIVAAVWRAANDNTITAADIVDKRCMLLGGVLGMVPTLIPIIGGIAATNTSRHTLSAQVGVADDLDGLAVSSIITSGEIVFISPDAGDTITVKHNALGGADARNILCIGNADIVLDDDHDFAICIYSTAIGAGSWMALGGGAAGGYDTIEEEGVPVVQRTTIDFVGTGVTAADVGGETRVTIPGTPWAALQTFNAGIATDTIAEVTPATGVTIDGVLLKDSNADLVFIRDFLTNQHIFFFPGGSTTFQRNVEVSGVNTVGIGTAPSAVTALKVSAAGNKASNYSMIEATTVGLVLTGNNRRWRGLRAAGGPSPQAGTIGHTVKGLEFLAAIGGGGGGTVIAEASAIEAALGYVGYTGTVTIQRGVYLPTPVVVGGAPVFPLTIGIDIENYGAYAACVDVFGLRIADTTLNTGFTRLLEVGPATPYLRVVGRVAPGAAATNVWADFGGIGLRQILCGAANSGSVAGRRMVEILN